MSRIVLFTSFLLFSTKSNLLEVKIFKPSFSFCKSLNSFSLVLSVQTPSFKYLSTSSWEVFSTALSFVAISSKERPLPFSFIT